MRAAVLFVALAATACSAARPAAVSLDTRLAVALCRDLWRDELNAAIDGPSLTSCLAALRRGWTVADLRARLHEHPSRRSRYRFAPAPGTRLDRKD
jgi:hypothetical protein